MLRFKFESSKYERDFYLEICEVCNNKPTSLTSHKKIFELKFHYAFPQRRVGRSDNRYSGTNEGIRFRKTYQCVNLKESSIEYKNKVEIGASTKPIAAAVVFDLKEVLATLKSNESSMY